jgi:DNA polymerase
MLDVFTRGEDPYRDMAARIYGRPADSFDKAGRERQLGKIAVLGLGYQMGADRFGRTCAQQGVPITGQEAETIKRIYREANPEIVQLWRTLEAAAIQAVQDPECWVTVANGRVGFMKAKGRMYLRLPSGRCLIYTKPRYELVESPFGPRAGLTFEGLSSATHRWERQSLYGGKLAENAVQALCRDLLASAMLRLEDAGYPIVLHVHDEIVAEVLEGQGDLDEFERLMAETSEWAKGFPVKAEGLRAKRFGK